MGYLDVNLGAAGRLMLAAGLIGFGLICLIFAAPTDGLAPTSGPDMDLVFTSRLLGVAWLATAILISVPRLLYAGQVAGFFVVMMLLLMHAAVAYGSRTWPSVVGWVSIAELLGIAAGLVALRPRTPESARAAPVIVGAMLILFGVVHWLYVDAIAGMIPAWMPGRTVWPLLTGTANIAAGLAIASGVLARPASALVGAMFASWILLVHTPRILAASGDRSEWVACALAFALTGVVWTVNGALHQSGGDLQSQPR
jgi:uncharacterized membrane protein